VNGAAVIVAWVKAHKQAPEYYDRGRNRCFIKRQRLAAVLTSGWEALLAARHPSLISAVQRVAAARRIIADQEALVANLRRQAIRYQCRGDTAHLHQRMNPPRHCWSGFSRSVGASVEAQ
jgi:hypothetical protein